MQIQPSVKGKVNECDIQRPEVSGACINGTHKIVIIIIIIMSIFLERFSM